MRREAVVEEVELKPLGEFRMGCDAYGIIIKTNFGHIETFKDVPIMIGQTDSSKCIEQSACTRYLSIKGAFSTYIVDIKDQAISIYRTTMRGLNNELCDENPIYGTETHHIKGLRRHYYLQFPFVGKDRFFQIFADYEVIRRRQIKELRDAL